MLNIESNECANMIACNIVGTLNHAALYGYVGPYQVIKAVLQQNRRTMRSSTQDANDLFL